MRLVSDWRQAWKWFSVQALALSTAILAIWQMLPPELKHSVPDQYVTYGTMAILVLGVIGRVVDQNA